VIEISNREKYDIRADSDIETGEMAFEWRKPRMLPSAVQGYLAKRPGNCRCAVVMLVIFSSSPGVSRRNFSETQTRREGSPAITTAPSAVAVAVAITLHADGTFASFRSRKPFPLFDRFGTISYFRGEISITAPRILTTPRVPRTPRKHTDPFLIAKSFSPA